MTYRKHKQIKKKKLQRECWALDFRFYEWLRERLPVYLHDADKIVDLNFYKQMYKGVEMTQREAIVRMIQLLDEYKFKDEWDEGFHEAMTEVRELWALWCPACWW